MPALGQLSPEQEAGWNRDGYFVVRGFTDQGTTEAMSARIVELARGADAGDDIGDALVVPEEVLADRATPEGRLSKLFRVHRHEPRFRAFCEDPRLLDLVTPVLGDDVDCFLSQFIFKHPGALGQPWHQDEYYFRFERSPQVGVWLAVTAATLDNGPLWVLPGSHAEPVHDAEPDRRAHANPFYVEIVDHDWSDAVPVLMDPGDLLVFHSHLMHRSTDNTSTLDRAAMVFHYARPDALGEDQKQQWTVNSNHDWLPVRRAA